VRPRPDVLEKSKRSTAEELLRKRQPEAHQGLEAGQVALHGGWLQVRVWVSAWDIALRTEGGCQMMPQSAEGYLGSIQSQLKTVESGSGFCCEFFDDTLKLARPFTLHLATNLFRRRTSKELPEMAR
jgi:hypothetical protein